MISFLDTIRPAIFGFATSALIVAGHPILKVYFGKKNSPQKNRAAFCLSTYIWAQLRLWKKQEEELAARNNFLAWLMTAERCLLDPDQFIQLQLALSKASIYFSKEESELIARRLIEALAPINTNLDSNEQRTLDLQSCCLTCRFCHARDKIVCAVHPFGYINNNCPDWEEKN